MKNIRNIFEDFFTKKNFEILPESKLINDDIKNTYFTISSMDNLIPILERKDSEFRFLNIQRTFRCKNSHIELWGRDAFLTPFNVMMSIFTLSKNFYNTIELSLEFIFDILKFDNKSIYCVYSKDNDSIIKNLYMKYIPKYNFIEVPKESLSWKLPFEKQNLQGRYIKLYKKHHTGFVLLCDCNIVHLESGVLVDIAYSLGVIEAIKYSYKTIYETDLYNGLHNIIKKEKMVLNKNDYKFIVLFISACIILFDGGKPTANKSGSIIRKVIRMLFNCKSDISKEIIDDYVEQVRISINNWGYVYDIDTANKAKNIFIEELDRLNTLLIKNEKHLNRIVDKFKNLNIKQQYHTLKEFYSTYGIDVETSCNYLYETNKITSTQRDGIINENKPFTPTCAITILNEGQNISKNFLGNLFFERIK